MDAYSDIDYSSESDVDHGLEEEYEAAKLLAAEGKVVDAIAALKTILDMDVEKSKWGFKACKRLVKLAMLSDRSAETPYLLLACYRKLFPFISSKSVSANDADKALDSLWSRFCSAEVEFSAKHQYCLLTWRHLGPRCSRITRMKWAARLSNHCVTDRDYADVEELADELELFVDRHSSLEDENESFKQRVFDVLLLVAHLNFRQQRYEQVHAHLRRLRDIAGEADVFGESRGVFKELKARVFVVTGHFSEASTLLRELLDEKSFLAAHPARYPRIWKQLRLLIQLMTSSAVFSEEVDDVVDRVIRCYRTNNKPGMLAAVKDVAEGDDSSAVLEICNALVRNMTFRRVSHDAWIDIFACLERYEIDSALLAGRLGSALVAAIAHRLPLRVITDVCVLGEISQDVYPPDIYRTQIARTVFPLTILDEQTVYQVQMSTDNGRTAKGRSFPYDHSYGRHADEPPFVSYLRCALAHSFIEHFDLLGSFPTWRMRMPQATVTPQINIQRLNYALATQSHLRFTGALQMLPLLGVTRVRELSLDIQMWDEGGVCSYLAPLSALNVTQLTCTWDRFAVTSSGEASFLQGCFAESESPASRHIILSEQRVRPDFVEILTEHARNSTCKNDVHLEIHLAQHASATEGLPEIGQATDYVWETNHLRIERDDRALIAWYSWQGRAESQ